LPKRENSSNSLNSENSVDSPPSSAEEEIEGELNTNLRQKSEEEENDFSLNEADILEGETTNELINNGNLKIFKNFIRKIFLSAKNLRTKFYVRKKFADKFSVRKFFADKFFCPQKFLV